MIGCLASYLGAKTLTTIIYMYEINLHNYLFHGLNSAHLYQLRKPVGSAVLAIVSSSSLKSFDCKGNIRACI